MSVPIGWPGAFEADTLDGAEGVPAIRDGYETIVTTTGDIAAAPFPVGPVLVSSVAGTNRAYTGVAAQAPVDGRVFLFAPHLESGAPVVTLQLTVGGVAQTARQLREDDGTQIVEGQIQPGRSYLLQYDGTLQVFRTLGEVLLPRVVRPTTYTWVFATPGDTTNFGRTRFRCFSDGDFLFDVGNGTNTWTSKFGFFDGATRLYDPVGYIGPAALGDDARIASDHRPPLTYTNIRRLIGTRSRMNARTSPQRLVISAAGYYQVGGLDQHRDIVIASAASGTWLDFIHAPKGATFNIICEGSAVVHLYTGEGTWSGDGSTPAALTAHSWINTGGKILTSSAGAWLRVRRSNTTFLAIADTGSVAAGTPTMPTHDVIVGFGPQSWGVDLRQNSAAGWQPHLTTLGTGSTKFYSPDTANVGASSLLYSASNSTLFHWDQRTDVPGQRLTDIIEAIKADKTARTTLMGTTAPNMTDFVWFFGLNEMEEWGPSSTHADNNPTVYVSSFVKMVQHMHTELGYTLRHWVIPLTSQKLGTFSEDKWHAIRMAQLRLPAAGAAASPAVTINITPEVYGDQRSGDEEAESGERHYDYPTHAIQAERLCQAWANVAHAQSNYLGPTITSVATADAGVGVEWDVTIDYGTGRSVNQAKRPESAGFRLLPVAVGSSDTDDFATPLTIVSSRWTGGGGTTIVLRVTLSEPYLAGTPRPSVLWGSAEATDEITSVIYALDPTSAKRYYLRQYLSGG